jgi:hypothetical protein
MAYFTLHHQQQQEHQEQQSITTNETCCQLSAVKIESMVKEFKTHRCALDFDSAFIKSVIIKQEETDN